MIQCMLGWQSKTGTDQHARVLVGYNILNKSVNNGIHPAITEGTCSQIVVILSKVKT